MNWLQRFDTFCFLDNHGYQLQPHSHECLAGAGASKVFSQPDDIHALQSFIDNADKTLFGHFNYEYGGNINTTFADKSGFPPCFFFIPEVVIRLNEFSLVIEAEYPQQTLEEILHSTPPPVAAPKKSEIKSRLTRDEYIATLDKLKAHILHGDCYEINFCQEFYAEQTAINPLEVFRKLADISPNPFSALYRVQDNWLLCASPERFLKRTGTKLLSQPIKGTAPRDRRDMAADASNKTGLQQSAKDRSENVMIVDLVRNDLARVCREGTVEVEELFGVYAFPQVYQMISTISGQVDKDKLFTEIFSNTFPMGSMTGAPKHRVMELIRQYEGRERGIFSGTVGYINPDGDFDFNVVIRSLIYDESAGYLSFSAGSGITFYSNPEQEWEECLLKAAALRLALA